ncbi:MAG: transcription antitermination factor NusB [Saccharofermentanales bacterium]|nr:transcription antitermination factor NusB [Bacillota bacterium]NLB08326.1 transcription antitermination factor NusB [Clostridiales bacterium]
MSRKLARERAFMFLYSLEIQPDDYILQRRLFLDEWRLSRADTDFFDLIVTGVLEHKAEFDQEIEPRLIGWAISRLPRIDLTIMRLALFEMKYLADVPTSVSISEAVILARKYSDEKSRSYINAVLGSIERDSALAGRKSTDADEDDNDDNP